MNASLRPGTSADLEACAVVWRRASEVGHPFLEPTDLDADEQLVRTIYLPAAELIVAVAEDRILGFIALAGTHIGGLFVDPACQRSGIGRRLVDMAAQDRGQLTVEAYVANAGARTFYARLGFREVLCQLTDDLGRPFPLVRIVREGTATR